MKSRADELEPKVRQYVLECWLAEKPLTLRGLAAALGELGVKTDAEGNVVDDWTSTAIRNYWHALAKKGVLIPANDSATRDEKLGFRARGYNLTGRSMAECTFRTMLEPYLTNTEVSKEDKAVLKEGLRRILPSLTGVALAGTKTDEMVLVAADRVAPDVVSKLQQILRESGNKGAEYARTLRNCLRHAMAHGHAVAILPTRSVDDPWTDWVARNRPLSAAGATDPKIERTRIAIKALRQELESMTFEERDGPMPATPDDVSAELATKAITRVLTVRGDHRNMPLYRRELVRLGEQGLGPYRAGAHLGVDLVVLADGIHPSPRYYLHSANPTANVATWDALLATLLEREIADEMIRFVEWARDFSTLSDRELALRKEHDGRKTFPTRREGFLVENGAELGRIRAFRAYVGAAVNLNGIAPDRCVPEMVFGQDYEVLTDAIAEDWAKRVDANMERKALGIPPLGQAKHAASTGVANLILVGGMIALMGYEQHRHRRGLHGAKARTGRDGADLGIDWGELRRSEKTLGEEMFAVAYEHSRLTGKKLESDRRYEPTHKPKGVVFADTPTADLMPATLERLRRRISGKHKDENLPFDAIALFAAGIIASGSSRIEEIAHIRLDRHFTPAHRAEMGIFLEAWDRKGDYCSHEIPLNEALTPRWLIDYVVDIARPTLLARWTARGHLPHNFVFVDARGRPFGDPNESADGKRRDADVINARKGKLSFMLKSVRLSALAAAKLPIVDGWGAASSHGDRGRIGDIGANRKGVGPERTGRLLGHRGKGSTVVRSYSRPNLEANRETLHDILMSREWYSRRFPMKAAGDPAYDSFSAERDEIFNRARDLKLSGPTVDQMLAEAMSRWGKGPTGRDDLAFSVAG